MRMRRRRTREGEKEERDSAEVNHKTTHRGSGKISLLRQPNTRGNEIIKCRYTTNIFKNYQPSTDEISTYVKPLENLSVQLMRARDNTSQTKPHSPH